VVYPEAIVFSLPVYPTLLHWSLDWPTLGVCHHERIAGTRPHRCGLLISRSLQVGTDPVSNYDLNIVMVNSQCYGRDTLRFAPV